MNKVQLTITAGLLLLFFAVNQLAGGDGVCARCLGGLPWYGWVGGFAVLFVAGVLFARRRGERAHELLAQPPPARADDAAPEADAKWNETLRRKYDWDGPDYPHPVIVTERCIGCHACVDACPHDVLTISYTEKNQPVASVVDPAMCLEDTSCESVCPVNPKACVVVNTAKTIKSPPAPWRDPHTYESSVPGCYVIGDVSGTPLIKNAANEGATLMVHLANELHALGGGDADAGGGAEYEVAIIGAGPAGLSAAVMAERLGLKYVCIEQDKVMSTIDKYSEKKYVFFKPETTEWAGAIHLPGLEEYVEEVLEEVLEGEDRARAAEMLAAEREAAGGAEGEAAAAKRAARKEAAEIEKERALAAVRETLAAARARYQRWLEAEVKGTLDADARGRLKKARERFAALLDGEEKYLLGQLLAAEAACQGKYEDARGKGRLDLARRQCADALEAIVEGGKLSEERFQALAAARCKVAGDQREVLLNTWLLNVKDSCVAVNENESCKSVRRAEDGGDYFVVQTERDKREDEKGGGADDGAKKLTTYRARRVVLAIGNSSSPTKLRVGGKEVGVKVKHGVGEKEKVQYRLSEPKAFANLKLIVVGGGNSAVEAAVDLVTWRDESGIVFRPPEAQNEVTMLVRSADFKTDVKFGNKQQLYRCIDRGLIRLRPNTEIKEVREGGEVVTTNLVTGEDDPPMENDFIFALIGSQRPAALLTQMKVRIVE